MTDFTPRALFFDFDGVLADSTTTKTEAFRTLFASFPTDIVEQIVAHHRQHGGISRVEKIRYAFETIINGPLSKAELDSYASHYSNLVVENVIRADWVKGARDYLESMYRRVPVFVVSGTPVDELRHIVAKRNMEHYFKEILGSPIKKPEHIKKVLTDYNLRPEQCVFVGDALTDYEAAVTTGLHFIGIYTEVEFPAGVLVLPDCSQLERAIRSFA